MREHVLAELKQGPASVDELAGRLRTTRAFVRSSLWFLVFTDRLVTARADGLFVLGVPPAEFPKMKEHV